jgi:hypothetical protein
MGISQHGECPNYLWHFIREMNGHDTNHRLNCQLLITSFWFNPKFAKNQARQKHNSADHKIQSHLSQGIKRSILKIQKKNTVNN